MIRFITKLLNCKISKRINVMKTFRDQYFKNEMHSLDAYYNCILSCEINPSSGSWQGVEENCEEKCMRQHLKAYFM